MEPTENSKGEAIRYWERRRKVWNLLLVPPAGLSYGFASGMAIGIGDPPAFGWPVVAALFCLAALGANICYSFAYVIEFWIQGARAEAGYRKQGRTLLFAKGCFLGMGFALSGGASIAQMQYSV